MPIFLDLEDPAEEGIELDAAADTGDSSTSIGVSPDFIRDGLRRRGRPREEEDPAGLPGSILRLLPLISVGSNSGDALPPPDEGPDPSSSGGWVGISSSSEMGCRGLEMERGNEVNGDV